MLRNIFRRPRTIRVPIDSPGYRIQPVRVFRGPLSTPSHFVSTFLIAYVLYQIVDAYDPFNVGTKRSRSGNGTDKSKPDQTGSKRNEAFSENWRKQHAALQKSQSIPREADAIQLPPTGENQVYLTIPVWIRKSPTRPYTPADPEWREYAKLQADTRKLEGLKKVVIDHVVRGMRQPIHLQRLKHIDFDGRAAFGLEVVPQLFPPAQYEIPALYLERDGISIGWRRLVPEVGARLDAMFRPGPTFAATTLSIKTFCQLSYRTAQNRVGEMLGYKPSPVLVPSLPVPITTVDEKTKESITAGSSNKTRKTPTTWEELRLSLLDMHSGNAKDLNRDLTSHLPFVVALKSAALVFRHKQKVDTALQKQKTTRGTVQIRGEAEFMGSKGKYKLQVLAVYSPAEDSFIGHIIINNAQLIQDFNSAQKSIDQQGRDIAEKKDQRSKKSQVSVREPTEKPVVPTTGKNDT